MVVFVVYAIYVLPDTGERDAPVAAHRHGPRAFSGATQFVEIEAGQVHIAACLGGQRPQLPNLVYDFLCLPSGASCAPEPLVARRQQ